MVLALRKSGLRSLLAIGSVGLGIASMMIMLALSSGAERELQAITDKIGRNLFVIKAGDVPPPPGTGSGWLTSRRLKESDAALLRQQVRGIREIVPILEGSVSARREREELTTTVRGVTPAFASLRNFQLQEGRLFDDQDGAARNRLAVVGAFVAAKLNDKFSMVGETIWVNNIPFEVIGQLREKGFTDGQNEDDQILIPLETAERRVFNTDALSSFLVQTDRREDLDRAESESREVLRAAHSLPDGARDDFNVLTLIRADSVRQMNSAFLQGLSQLFAVIMLIIGGAGVLAVTYLNVKDRTSEIGLRMAIGARQKDIAGLFIAESCVLSGLGGVFGIVAGLAAVAVLAKATQWQMAVDWRGIVVPFVAAVILGLLFGVAPAVKASRVMPCDALRDAA